MVVQGWVKRKEEIDNGRAMKKGRRGRKIIDRFKRLQVKVDCF